MLIYGLAVWRIASMFVREEGPFRIFRHFREILGISHDLHGEITIIPDRFLAQAFSCVWCLSMWVGVFWAAFWLTFPEWSLKIAIPFAFSALAVVVDKWVNQ